MSRRITPGTTLDDLKREAKRWLRALRAGDVEARARFERALAHHSAIPDTPSLRDVQHALARELGFPGWTALREHLAAAAQRRAAERTDDGATLARYERMAANLLDAFRTGTPEAMERHWNDTWHRRAWKGMRRYVLADLGRPPETDEAPADISIDDARLLVAREAGFESWHALRDFALTVPAGSREFAAKPLRLFAEGAGHDEEAGERTRYWDAALEMLGAGRASGLDANGQMSDAMLERLSRDEPVAAQLTALRLASSPALTDDGLRHLARLPRLRHLDLGECRITDRALRVLRELPALESISLAGTPVTDEGAAHLAHCETLRRVDLSWTRTGDGAIRALAGKRALHELRSGVEVSNDGLALLAELPVFASWQGGEPTMALLSADAGPNYLSVRGPFTDDGLAHLARLEGLFALHIDDRRLRITAAGLAPLATLPHLGWLAFHATDDAMPHIAAMPALRFLSCQDTPATDDGFAALGRSRSIEYIWAGHCSGLRGRGFRALASMPSLRALSASLRDVDDDALATLPGFPALRELMPIDLPDDGYRHIGTCEGLESLVLMYCRDTSDAATAHIATLARLNHYFASYTQITDRTPELLARMPALERIELHGCAGVTNAGIAALASSPRLRELRLSGMQRVTRDALAALPPRVRAHWSM